MGSRSVMCFKVDRGCARERHCPVQFGITELALVSSERKRLEWGGGRAGEHVRELGNERKMTRQKRDGPKLGHSSGS